MSHIGEYDLLYRLGTGGMGNVYLARRRNESGLHRLFAVKAMHAVLSADAEFANMFLDEAHIASQLHHINIVGIVDLGRYAGRLFLVMDYVEGPTLAHLMSAAAMRPPALVCSIVIDLLHGLHAAHSLTNEAGERLELVHRDVSPSNILVGTDGVARLTDFGIAKARMRRTSTSPGVRKGKLSYSAPEQITNPGGEDSRVDVFAAGVVLWNALTGSRLFDGDNEASVILSVITRPIPPPSEIGLRPPACLDRVCLRALSRDPADRYASAAEMADDLRRVTRQNDLVVGPEQVAAWVQQLFGDELAQRRAAIRATAGGTDPGAGSLALGTGPHAPELDVEYVDLSVSSSGEAAGSIALHSRGRQRLMIALVALAVCAVAVVGGLKFLSMRDAKQAAQPSAEPAPARVPALEAPAPAAPAPAAQQTAAGTAVPAATGSATTNATITPAVAVEPPAATDSSASTADAKSAAATEDEEDSADDDDSKSESKGAAHNNRRRKPAPPPPAKRRPTPARSSEQETAPAPAQEPAKAPPPPPAASDPPQQPSEGEESIETNPYFRRGK